MILVAPRARLTAWRRDKTRLPREAWVLIGANVVAALGYGVVSPVLPAYARTFGVSMDAVTFAITMFSVMRLFFAPPSGLLVQRLGERPVYLVGSVDRGGLDRRCAHSCRTTGNCWYSGRSAASGRRCSSSRRWV